MNNIFYIYSVDQLEKCIKQNVKHIVLCHEDLSRFGGLNSKSFNHLAAKAFELKMNVSLEWDVIKTENDFLAMISSFESIDTTFLQSIRVQDRGVLNWVFDNTQLDIDLILEGSHHNLTAIKSWESILGPRLKKLILSIEISKETLKGYIKELKTPVETLVLGRILLFYTPRNLLSSLKPKNIISNDYIEAIGESEESPHKGFPLVENKNGTFMFHIKRLNLTKHLEELKELGLTYARFDNRFDDEHVFEDTLKQNFSDYPYDSIKGFFNINKSDVLFKKLKNYRIQRKDSSYAGEVLEIKSKSFIAMKVKKQDLKVGDKLKFFTPDGKEKILNVKSLRDSALNEVDVVKMDSIAILTYLSGISVKSQAYKIK